MAAPFVGISIVGGKVDLYNAAPGGKTVISGISSRTCWPTVGAAALLSSRRATASSRWTARTCARPATTRPGPPFAVRATRSSLSLQSLVHRSRGGAAGREGASGDVPAPADASEPAEPPARSPSPEVIQPGYKPPAKRPERLASEASVDESLEEDEEGTS
ncbi:mitochondrial antiviral-signaling protein-like [Pollicipes pollicipes]|uniref:mitochondrial antiviral-signaling protein-like n=1 Tax=Pollicipes pollicipes TaxID=41117 RepID=UPI001884E98C|nr:mitochondrial antiviral-signaling protein-like [Pollicipes pollicipes]